MKLTKEVFVRRGLPRTCRVEVTSVEEGHDVESDVAEETMSAVVKLAEVVLRHRPADRGMPGSACDLP